MSDLTSAQEEAAADAMLDAQIAEMYAERHQPVNRPDLEEPPDAEPPPWYEDHGEVVTFARWYWDGMLNAIGTAAELLDFFEKPWKWTPEYEEGFLAQKVKII